LKAHCSRLLLVIGFLCACSDSETPAAAPGAGGTRPGPNAPTWHQHIAPIVNERCASCHQPGGIAPFSLQTYAQAAPFSGYLADQVENGSMPPFLAATTDECEPRFGFKDDLRLSREQIDLFRAWHEAQAPEGDASRAAAVPEPVALTLDDADVTITIPSPVTVEGAGDRFVCFSLAPDLSPLAASGPAAQLLGDRVLLDAAQVSPGNAAIVHHVLVYTDAEGESAALAGEKGYYDCFGGPGLSSPGLLVAWAPGSTPIRAPERVAMVMPSTGRLVMQVHYHPTGAAETDSSTSLQLRRFKAGIPEYVANLELIGNSRSREAGGMGLQPGPADAAAPEFKIPAGAAAHTESMLFQVPAGAPEYRLWAVGSHMHYVGTDMRIAIERSQAGAEPDSECLLQTPDWDFNWQRGYLYDIPIEDAPSMKAGDVLNLRCTYDNSMQNRFVSEALLEQGLSAPRDVFLGEETLDEMCLGIFGVARKVSDFLE
jgi:mono/diheme cytochrome c family protein